MVVGFEYDQVNVSIDTKDKEFNKSLFDYLYDRKEDIEKEYGKSLIWDRLSDNRASRIKDEISCHTFELEDKTEVFEFMRSAADRLYQVFRKHILEFSRSH